MSPRSNGLKVGAYLDLGALPKPDKDNICVGLASTNTPGLSDNICVDIDKYPRLLGLTHDKMIGTTKGRECASFEFEGR